jgi:uncharacterized protein YdaU (DUF1376 family)
MAEAPFWPVEVGPLQGDTMDLSDAEYGAYMRLMAAQWANKGQPLARTPAKLARIAGTPEKQWQARWRGIAHYFEVQGDMSDPDALVTISQLRVADDYPDVLAKIDANRERAAKAGRASALKRKGRHQRRVQPKEQHQEQQQVQLDEQPTLNSEATKDKDKDKSSSLRSEEAASARPVEPYLALGAWILETAGMSGDPRRYPLGIVRQWLADYGEEAIRAGVKAVMARPGQKQVTSLNYFPDAIREAAAKATNDRLAYARAFVADFTEHRWLEYLGEWSKGLPWPEPIIGPPPNHPDTLVWGQLLERYRMRYGNLEPVQTQTEQVA